MLKTEKVTVQVPTEKDITTCEACGSKFELRSIAQMHVEREHMQVVSHGRFLWFDREGDLRMYCTWRQTEVYKWTGPGWYTVEGYYSCSGYEPWMYPVAALRSDKVMEVANARALIDSIDGLPQARPGTVPVEPALPIDVVEL